MYAFFSLPSLPAPLSLSLSVSEGLFFCPCLIFCMSTCLFSSLSHSFYFVFLSVQSSSHFNLSSFSRSYDNWTFEGDPLPSETSIWRGRRFPRTFRVLLYTGERDHLVFRSLTTPNPRWIGGHIHGPSG